MTQLAQVCLQQACYAPAPAWTHHQKSLQNQRVQLFINPWCADLHVPAVKVITGSLQGVLRVHQPHQQGYHIEDILLEAQLDSSILQLAAGNFLGYVTCLTVNSSAHHSWLLTSSSSCCAGCITAAVLTWPACHTLHLHAACTVVSTVSNRHHLTQVCILSCLQRDQPVPGSPASTQAVSVHLAVSWQQLSAA